MMGSSQAPVPDIPVETFQAAREVYHIDQIYLLIGDHLEDLLTGLSLPELDPTATLGSSLTYRLALVTGFQFAERIPDELAAQDTLKRMDWKYALHLPIQHPGYSARALCHFRQNLFSSASAKGEFTHLLRQMGRLGLYKRSSVQSLEAGEALATVCNINRLHQLKTAMKSTLSWLVVTDPDWLRGNALPHWYLRYQTGRLGQPSEQDLHGLENEIAAVKTDIEYLLSHISGEGSQSLRSTPEVLKLRCMWERLEVIHRTPGEGRPDCTSCAGLECEMY